MHDEKVNFSHPKFSGFDADKDRKCWLHFFSNYITMVVSAPRTSPKNTHLYNNHEDVIFKDHQVVTIIIKNVDPFSSVLPSSLSR